MQQDSRKTRLFLASVLLASAALVCAQAGQVVSDAEATQLAAPTSTPDVDLSGEAEFQIGETATVVGGSFGALVPLYGSPGGRFFTSQVPQGAPVVVLQLGQAENGEIWYEVEGQAGAGWLRAENLVASNLILDPEAGTEE